MKRAGSMAHSLTISFIICASRFCSIRKTWSCEWMNSATASANGGTTWDRVGGTLNGATIPNDPSGKPALTGSSGGNWSDIAIPLNAYAGKAIKFRLHYVTDGGVSAGGFFGDELTISANGATVLTFNSGSMVQGEVTVSNGVVYLPQANGNLMAAGL